MNDAPIAADLMQIGRRIVDETGIDGTPYYGLQDAVATAIARALMAERERCVKAAMKAMPPAHTYASENADIYRAQDHARDLIIAAIRRGSS